MRHLVGFADFIDDALHEMCAEMGVRRDDLARAMGRNRANLSLGRLKASQTACAEVVWRLNLENRPHLAVALRLNAAQYRTLQKHAIEILSRAYGYAIDPDWRGTRGEAMEMAEAGLALFDASEWGAASTHLETAWGCFARQPPNVDDPHHAVTLRVGSQLASLFLHQARVSDAVLIIRDLSQLPRGASNADAIAATAAFYTCAAVVSRHQGLQPPEQIVAWDKRALHLLDGIRPAPNTSSSAWRDQAKPLAQWALGASGRPPSPGRFDDALHALQQAEACIGGPEPEERFRWGWLMNRLTQVECMAAALLKDEARHTWDDTLQHSWVARIVGPRLRGQQQTALDAKVALAELAIAFCEGDLERVEGLAQRARHDMDRAHYVDHIKRVGEIENAARQENVEALRRAFVR